MPPRFHSLLATDLVVNNLVVAAKVVVPIFALIMDITNSKLYVVIICI